MTTAQRVALLERKRIQYCRVPIQDYLKYSAVRDLVFNLMNLYPDYDAICEELRA